MIATTLCCCCCSVQVGNLKVTYSVHTQAGADLGGNVKDNQVGAKLSLQSASTLKQLCSSCMLCWFAAQPAPSNVSYWQRFVPGTRSHAKCFANALYQKEGREEA